MPWFAQETFAFRREAYDAVGGLDRTMRFAMDYDLFVRLLSHGRAHYVPRMLGAFRWHNASKSATLQATVGAEDMRVVRARNGLPNWPRLHPGRVSASVLVRAASTIHACLPHAPAAPMYRPTKRGMHVRELFQIAGTVEPSAIPSDEMW